jgi:hypothetical protein
MTQPTILPGDEVECIFPGPWRWMEAIDGGEVRYRDDGPALASRWIVAATWLAGDDFTPHDMIALEGFPYRSRWAAKRFRVVRLAHVAETAETAEKREP